MPISVKELTEKGAEVGTITRGHKQVEVLEWFRQHPQQAFTQAEVAAAFSGNGKYMAPQQARQICRALVKRGPLVMRQFDTGSRVSIFYALAPQKK